MIYSKIYLDLQDKFHFSIDDVFHSFMDLEFQKIKIKDRKIYLKLYQK